MGTWRLILFKTADEILDKQSAAGGPDLREPWQISATSTRYNTLTDTKADSRRSDSGFLHPPRGTPPNHTPVALTERYWG